MQEPVDPGGFKVEDLEAVVPSPIDVVEGFYDFGGLVEGCEHDSFAGSFAPVEDRHASPFEFVEVSFGAFPHAGPSSFFYDRYRDGGHSSKVRPLVGAGQSQEAAA